MAPMKAMIVGRTMAAFVGTTIGLLCIVSLANAQYSIDIKLSAQEVVAGGQVTVTCDVTNLANGSFTLVWVRRRYDNAVTAGIVTSSSPSSAASETRADEESIGSNGHMEDHFLATGRYSAKYEIVTKLTRVKFVLTITDLKAADSGDVGCRIPVAKIDAFRPFTVLVPAQSIRLTSRNSIASHAQSYIDGETITFADGETRRVSCQVNGSHPAADVRITVGDDDVTERFTKTADLVRTGPSNNTALQDFYYVTELYQSAMTFDSDLSGKSLRCIAYVPGSNFTAVSTRIIASFNSYKPKFVNCSGPRVSAAVHQTGVHLRCDVQAQPPITDAWISWSRFPTTSDRVMKLGVGKRDGHYYVELRTHNPNNDFLQAVSLNIDKLYPQHFTKYTFVAENSEGISETQIELVRSQVAVSNAVLARHSAMTMMTWAFTAGLLLARRHHL